MMKLQAKFLSGNAADLSFEATLVKKLQKPSAIDFLSVISLPSTSKDFEEMLDVCLTGKTFLISFQNLFGSLFDSFRLSLKNVRCARLIRLVTKFLARR